MTEPEVWDLFTPEEAEDMLQAGRRWGRVPASIRARLRVVRERTHWSYDRIGRVLGFAPSVVRHAVVAPLDGLAVEARLRSGTGRFVGQPGGGRTR